MVRHLLPLVDIVSLRGSCGFVDERCENLILDFNLMWHVFILNRYLKRYVTELHDNGSDSALLFCHIRRRIRCSG